MRWLAIALALAVATPPAWAQGDKKAAKAKKDKKDKKDKDADADDSSDDSSDSDDSDDSDKKDKKAKGAKKADKADKSDKDDKADKEDKSDTSDKDDEGGGDEDEGGEKGRDKADTGSKAEEPVKQDLNGHDLGTRKKTTDTERDRFFVDKSDTEATENKTLIQGSLTSSSFLYNESGGTYALAPGSTTGSNQTGDANGTTARRLFTDLRLQTDFRHIAGSRWEARIDTRARFVNSGNPANEPGLAGTNPDTHFQSGLTGQNEYEVRELWLIRNGERTDLTFGRQFIADLAAVKIDGLRVDYASSPKLTFLGFAGLYPLRGSRSITTDYPDIKDPTTGMQLSKFVGSGGFGAAYRTPTAYGSFGGVALVPTASEQPRLFATANGYWRPNPKVDIYHFALLDLISSYGAQITNLSGGVNYKPTQRLRMTASYNRVDTDTLNIQAQAFLDQAQPNPVIQNEINIARLATNQARGSISAGLGNLQRFEITVASAYRYRPAFSLTPVGMGAAAIPLPAAKSVEVYGSIVDRRSYKDARIGVDGVQTFGVGTVAYQRDEVFALRGFVGRELDSGKGEWEAEISYAESKDTNIDYNCTNVVDCYGSTSGTVISAGGTLYYRFNRDWFMIAQAYLARTTLTRAMLAADPTITGLTGYARFAYRF
jgi:hypothetical protein